ncbi:MAG TPA: pyridoxamine 5'-phosphate oxidase family protein [Streptosporangiaceae bacterium]|nr:pyridoxamine 5'-phosphate oxidase family protein [Streptosporangiaceae bacterium]
MGKLYAELDERLTEFIVDQPVYFVATAPLASGPGGGGHVNVSPKGCRGTFAVLGPRTVAYLDLTGSGAETIAHIRQNGRITIMFCSFGDRPMILRLYGTGRVVLPGEQEWGDLLGLFTWQAGDRGDGDGNGNGDRGDRRAVIVVELARIADSCGYAVPLMDLRGERDLLIRWSEKKTPDGLAQYRDERNAVSIDGLPALPPANLAVTQAPGTA